MNSTTPDQGTAEWVLLDHMTSKVSSGYILNINKNGGKGTKILKRDHSYVFLYIILYVPCVK